MCDVEAPCPSFSQFYALSTDDLEHIVLYILLGVLGERGYGGTIFSRVSQELATLYNWLNVFRSLLGLANSCATCRAG